MTAALRVYIIDETYGHSDDDWEQQSEAFRKRLEAEYQRPLEYDDIGTGASQPAFFATLIELVPYAAVVSLFFAGKQIEGNLEAWAKIYERLKKLLNRNPVLNKEAASVLAIKAVIDAVNHMPPSLQLTGYSSDSAMVQPYAELCTDLTRLIGIEEPERTCDATIHVFQIEAGSRSFKVFIYRSEVTLLEVK